MTDLLSPNSPENPDDVTTGITADVPVGVTATQPVTQADTQVRENRFPVVALGASAGGLEAFERFFTHLPTDTGMAFVLIQHLDPTHHSMLTELVARYTTLPVHQVENGMKVEPNHVYVIPPNREMTIRNSELLLQAPDLPRGFRLPIDAFFRSLGRDQGSFATGIILSGTGSDGTAGLKVIKENEGLIIAQSPASAKYTGMPRSAIVTRLADLILPPEEMPQALIAYYARAGAPSGMIAEASPERSSDVLREIFQLLRTQTGHDFAQYKLNTITRRIERRMIVNRINSIENYLHFLKTHRAEVPLLFSELLIGVTSFFRDAEAFEVLRTQVIPELCGNPQKDIIRVWVPGCSTGEEAYSLAILFSEHRDQTRKDIDIQIFATDIDEEAVNKARTAIYPENIVSEVPEELLEKYFTHVNGHYTVNKEIRSMVVIAQQSVIRDPPFSHLDLISCRNLLIYLTAEVQKPVIGMFHYALNDSGFLFLGSSETLTGFTHMFEPIDKRNRIFRCIKGIVPQPLDLNFGLTDATAASRIPKSQGRPLNIRAIAEKTLLNRYAHPSVIIDERGDILYFYGDTNHYLQSAQGEASLNILRMARQEIRPLVAAHLRRISALNDQTTEENVRLIDGDQVETIRLIFQPLEQALTNRKLILVIFEHITVVEAAELSTDGIWEGEQKSRQRIVDLEHDLQTAHNYLQATVEDLETSNEELISANEELQSANEELQSTNEELETTREELQAINEELITVNAELNEKVDALYQANNNQINLLKSIDIGLIFLNDRLAIQLFNPIAAGLLNLMDNDIGRPIQHFAQNFDYHSFHEECERVLDTLQPFSREVFSTDQRWFVLRISPYRTQENIVAGLIITFTEITEQKSMLEQIAQREYLYRALVRNLPNTIAFLFDHNKRFVIVEGQGLKALGYVGSEVEGKTLEEITQIPENIPLLNKIYDDTLRGESLQFELSRGDVTFELATAPIYDKEGRVEYGLLTGRDISGRKRIANILSEREQTYRAMVDHLPGMALMVFDHEMRFLLVGGDALAAAGFNPGEMVGRTLQEVLPEEHIPLVIDHYRAALEGRKSAYISEFNGQKYQVLGLPIQDIDGRVRAGMMLTYRMDDQARWTTE